MHSRQLPIACVVCRSCEEEQEEHVPAGTAVEAQDILASRRRKVNLNHSIVLLSGNDYNINYKWRAKLPTGSRKSARFPKSRGEMSTQGWFPRLPTDVHIRMLSHLDSINILASAERSCKSLAASCAAGIEEGLLYQNVDLSYGWCRYPSA